MARKIKLTAKAGDTAKQPEFKGCTLVNVLRVPRIAKGEWEKSNRGSLLFDTLCFPITVPVAVKAKSKTEHSKWLLTVGGKDMDIAQARAAAIGFGSLKDTTTGLEYMIKTASGDDAMPAEVKKTIIRRCKRVTVKKRLQIVCKLVESLADMQGIGDCFNDDERALLFNVPATLLNKFKDALHKVKAEDTKASYFSAIS